MKEKGSQHSATVLPMTVAPQCGSKSPMSNDCLVHAGCLGTQAFPAGCLEPVATAQGTSVRLWGCRAVKPLTGR